MIEQIKEQVNLLFSKENSGHGLDHIERVYNLAIKFAQEENANILLTSIIALLHDADDYKTFGKDEEQLENAQRIMNECNVPDDIAKTVCSQLRTLGYSKRLKGLSPNTIEGKIVSDADMCDALGASGIIRTHSYGIKHNRPFFLKAAFPRSNFTADEYKSNAGDSSVCQMFEKILLLKKYMLTNSGQKEAIKRHDFTISFLYHLFEEENAYEWKTYLDEFLKNNY